jgi:copper homeostasis protein
LEGIEMLKQLVLQSENRIQIMAGSGVNAAQIPELWKAGVRHFHASASSHFPSPMQFRNPLITMGKEGDQDEYLRTEADPQKIKALVEAIQAHSTEN